MCKYTFTIFILLTSVWASADGLYGGMIYADSVNNKEYSASVNDLRVYLSIITSRAFSTNNGKAFSGKGVFIGLNSRGLLSQSLEQKVRLGSVENFVISGNADRLLIVANDPSGLTKGIYTYLDWLGVRWYFPGKKWEKYSYRTSIIYMGTNYLSPSFSYRNFFGTGGIRPVPPIDNKGNLAQEWEDWKRRNRLGNEADIAGHYGEAFNISNKALLTEHPEFLALVNGKREWNISSKWCISNTAFRQIFVQDRVKELRERLGSSKNSTRKIIVSVDPSDGGPDCECEACRSLGSVSDRDFMLANEVAEAFSKISSRAYVSLLAYSTHAATPSFSIEPNVIVLIVPYAFQNFRPAEQMITLWTKKTTNVVVYDYYCIPDWFNEVPEPSKTSLDTLIRRIEYWNRAKTKGFLLESVYGAGLAGLGLYLSARLGWDAKTDVKRVTDEFLKDMFGVAATEGGQFFDFIKNNYSDRSSLPYLINLLDKAYNKAGTLTIERIIDLKAYVHYLGLYYQWQLKDSKGKEWADLVQYIWEIYPRAMIHSTRIAELFLNKIGDDNPLMSKWRIVEPYGNELLKIRFADDKVINRLFDNDKLDFPLLKDFGFEKAKVFKYALSDVHLSGNAEDKLILGGNFPTTFVKASRDGSVRFQLKLNETETVPMTNVLIRCIDTTTQQVVYSKTEPITKTAKEILIRNLKDNVYRLDLQYKNWLRIILPSNQWSAFANIPTYGVMNTLWFYVPAGTKYIYFSNEIDQQPLFKDYTGKTVASEKVNNQHMYRLAVMKSDGQWWSVSASEYKKLRFYSVPDLFFSSSNYKIQ